MFLNIQDRLETLARTIADSVPLRARAERPGAFRRVPIRRRMMLRILHKLRMIKPPQHAEQALPVLRVVREARLDERLRRERDVPQLAAVRPGHHHALRADPHEGLAGLAVEPVRLALGAVDDGAHDEVHHLRDGPQGLVRRVLVLHHDELVALVQRGAAERWDGAGLVRVDEVQGRVVERGVRHVEVDLGDIAPLCGPVYLIVVLGVEFLDRAISSDLTLAKKSDSW